MEAIRLPTSAEKGDLDTIRLAVNPWNGSAVNVAVAKQLLENELGYTVETVDIDEEAQWAAINTGDLHASLEMWPSGHAHNVADFIDNPDGNVVNVGLLGPVGKIGWFIPTFVIERYPALATWEGFLDPELAGMFATAETDDLGQFLGGDPSWFQYDDDIIANLGLHLEVVWAGSEDAILAAVDASVRQDEPVLVSLWTPHSAIKAYDLSEVKLPAYSDECYATADADGVDCDYPADDLFKIAWAGLEEAAPAAWSLLSNMSYTTADQISMLAAVESEGKSIDEAAAEWIAGNEATWRPWLSGETSRGTGMRLPGEGVSLTMAGGNWLFSYFQAELLRQLMEMLGYEVSDPADLELDSSQAYLAMAQGEADFWVNSWNPDDNNWLAEELPDGSLVVEHVRRVGELTREITAAARHDMLANHPAAAKLLEIVELNVVDLSDQIVRQDAGEDVGALVTEWIANNREQVDAWIAEALAAV